MLKLAERAIIVLMIGLVIVGHGTFASTMKRAMEFVVGKQEYVIPIDIGPDDDMEARREEIREAVRTADQGNGVIICSDFFGGTPSNLTISMLEIGKVDVIAGCNLPMLIKLANSRTSSSLEDTIQTAKEAGQRYIAIASKVMAGDDGIVPDKELPNKYQNLYLSIQTPLNFLRNEIKELELSKPNSEEKIKEKSETLAIFKLIELRLSNITSLIKKIDDENADIDKLLAEVDDQTQSLREEIDIWWNDNKAEFVDLTIRFPFIAGTIALLNTSGATPLLATAAAIAAFGGPKLYNTIRGEITRDIKASKK